MYTHTLFVTDPVIGGKKITPRWRTGINNAPCLGGICIRGTVKGKTLLRRLSFAIRNLYRRPTLLTFIHVNNQYKAY